MLINRRTEIDDPTARTKRLPILVPQHRTATRGKHNTLKLTKLRNSRSLTLAKPRLPLDIKYQRDAGPSPLLDLLVGVLERQTQLFGKQTPDGAFSSTHRAYEDQILHLSQRPT